MKKLCRCISFIILCLILNTDVYAVTLDNDGSALETPYGDCKAPSSFPNAKYYDCYVPYNVKVRDIGGWSTGVIAYTYDTYNYSMQSYYPNRIDSSCFSYVVNGYMPMSSGWHGASVSGDDTGAQVFTDSRGNKYYGMAIQEFFYCSGKEGSDNFPTWNNPAMLGQLVDVILTDGTVIHFVILDANDSAHTNGGPMEASLWNVQYTYSSMKLDKYKHLFHAACGNCIELAGVTWGAGTSGLMNKYGLGEDGNKIAYYRMYNVKIDDSPERESSVGKEVSNSLGDVTISGKKEDSSSSDVTTIGDLIPEEDLRGMPKHHLLNENAGTVNLATKKGLSQKEQSTLNEVKSSIEEEREDSIIRKVRVLITLIGMLMLLYIVFLYAAFAFDYANIYVDISLLKIVSFGFISLDSKGMNSDKKLHISRLHMVAIVLFLVGIILISGSMNMWIFRFVKFMQDKLG